MGTVTEKEFVKQMSLKFRTALLRLFTLYSLLYILPHSLEDILSLFGQDKF